MSDRSELAKHLHISVVVASRNRPMDIRRCLNSLSSISYPDWDVLVVDQSDDQATAQTVQNSVNALPNLMYCHMHQKGLSRARNLGLEMTNGDIVAFLDDDCTVGADWLEQVAQAFLRYPHAALVFGTVKAIQHNPRDYFVPVYPVKTEHSISGLRAFMKPDGMGATMSVRRIAARHIGPFDVYLGVGSGYVNGGEDNDYIYRCLVSSYSVVRSPLIILEHYGARPYSDGTAMRHLINNARCAAAIDMKLLRCGHVEAFIVMASHSAFFLLEIVRRGPSNLRTLSAYAGSLVSSFRIPVDRRRGLFIQR